MVRKAKVNPKQKTLNPSRGRFIRNSENKRFQKTAERYQDFAEKQGDIVRLATMKMGAPELHKQFFGAVNVSSMTSIKLDPTAGLSEVIKRYYMSPKASMVAYVYSANSRVIKGTETTLAVKMMDGTRGWLTLDGRFFSEADLYRLMQSFDGTLVGTASGISLTEIFEKMNARQRAKLFEQLQDVNWEEFWEVQYDPSNAFEENIVSAYYNLVDKIDKIIS